MVQVLSVSISEEFNEFIKLHNLSASQLLQEKIRQTMDMMNTQLVKNLKNKVYNLSILLQSAREEIEDLRKKGGFQEK
jgi:hypothetical protein